MLKITTIETAAEETCGGRDPDHRTGKTEVVTEIATAKATNLRKGIEVEVAVDLHTMAVRQVELSFWKDCLWR